MKIHEAITEVDNLKPNAVSKRDKIRALYRLDCRIWRDIIAPREELPKEEPTVYTEDDLNRELLVGEPYAELYIHWLEAQIDYANLEYEGFNATNAVFESVFEAFRNDYNRHHMRKGVRKNVF